MCHWPLSYVRDVEVTVGSDEIVGVVVELEVLVGFILDAVVVGGRDAMTGEVGVNIDEEDWGAVTVVVSVGSGGSGSDIDTVIDTVVGVADACTVSIETTVSVVGVVITVAVLMMLFVTVSVTVIGDVGVAIVEPPFTGTTE